MESGLVEDHSTPQGVVQLQFTLSVVRVCGRVQIGSPDGFDFVLIVKLDLMVLVLLMELNTIIFGVMWLV